MIDPHLKPWLTQPEPLDAGVRAIAADGSGGEREKLRALMAEQTERAATIDRSKLCSTCGLYMKAGDDPKMGAVCEGHPEPSPAPASESPSVAHPSHYTQGKVECIDALRACLGPEGFRGFCRGNAIKYLWRLGHKGNPDVNLAKAQQYLIWLGESLE